MTPQELHVLFSIRGIRTRVAKDEVQVQECVVCGNPKWNLEINPVIGLFHCWVCGARGRASHFIRDYLGVSVFLPVRIDQSSQRKHGPQDPPEVHGEIEHTWALDYLYSRGLDLVDFNIYEIGEGQGDVWGDRVVFRVRDYWTREPVGYIGRSTTALKSPKYYAYWIQGEKKVTGYIHPGSKVHVVVEGVFDGVRVHQAGMNAAVLSGVHEAEVEEWAARVPEQHTIVVLLDADAAIQSERLFWRLYPIHLRSIFVLLPDGVDPGSLELRSLHELIRRKIQHVS